MAAQVTYLKEDLHSLRTEVVSSGTALFLEVKGQIEGFWAVFKVKAEESERAQCRSNIPWVPQQAKVARAWHLEAKRLLNQTRTMKGEQQTFRLEVQEQLSEFKLSMQLSMEHIQMSGLFRQADAAGAHKVGSTVPGCKRISSQIQQERFDCGKQMCELSSKICEAVRAFEDKTWLAKSVLEHAKKEALRLSCNLQEEVWNLQAENHYLQECLVATRAKFAVKSFATIGPACPSREYDVHAMLRASELSHP
mmetsp:Transcript_23300/g.36458  ORF Transcript_23300/g.36458 Transcript_23300/m.36458 type:complete len:251 (+) Transcript_23300:444-1196(+)